MTPTGGAIIWISTIRAPFAGLVVDAYASAGGPQPTDVVLVPPDRKRPRGAFSFLLAVRSIAAVYVQMLAEPKVRASICNSRNPTAPYDRWGAKVRFMKSINSPEGEALLRERPSYLISAGLPEIVSSHLLSLATQGAINVHNGRLPEARGHSNT